MCRRAFILLMIVSFVSLGNVSESHAFTFLDGKFNVTGLYELLTGVHTADHSLDYASSGDFSLFRHRADIQATYRPTENIEFFTIFRAHWDGLYAIESGIDRRPRKRDQIEHHEYLREWIIKLYWNNFSFLIGKQQVVWGETDALRMADIINPLDVSWHSSLEAWEDIRIPLRMIRMIYRLPIAYEMDIDLVYIPEDYRMTKLWPEGHNWQNPNVNQYTLDVMHRQSPSHRDSIDNNEVGIRIRGVFGGWELSVFDFYGRMDDPPFKVNPNQFPIPPSLYFDFPQTNTVGATANYFEGKYTKSVFRFECAYNMGEAFTQFNYAPVFIGAPFPIMDVLPNKIVERDTFAYMFGFDRPTMWPFLNPTKSFFISGQLFQKFIRNYRNLLAPMNNNRDEDTAISLLINTWYRHDTIQPEILAVYFTDGEGWIKPQIKWAPDHQWELALGMFWFFGNGGDFDGVFGAYHKNDEVFIRLRYKF